MSCERRAAARHALVAKMDGRGRPTGLGAACTRPASGVVHDLLEEAMVSCKRVRDEVVLKLPRLQHHDAFRGDRSEREVAEASGGVLDGPGSPSRCSAAISPRRHSAPLEKPSRQKG